ncbi:MAG TPA: MBL fold metallo-hydrolase [Ramlibacter sp.]|uniref:MBL fold metallo-hydrolase n=1 Tax=Ramlibacter sp. TaxID=1917967 RepID=UPI002ED5790F
MPALRIPLSLTVVAAALALAACATRVDAPASQASVDAHVAQARQLAGGDLQMLMPLCQPQPATRPDPTVTNNRLAQAIAAPPPEPGQVFDNLYFVGSAWVTAWVLKTSDGLILIDALNNALEARGLIDGGMARLGLDPRQIKYVIVTHGHGDHYGGANYIRERYGARVVASEDDWRMMETALEFSSPHWGAPPKRDISVKDGDRLTLGDTTMTFYVTPGHTVGTLSPVFDVKTGGRSHKALLWGGTSFNFGKDFGRLESYAAATERMRRMTAQLPVDVLLSNHAGWDGTLQKMAALRASGGRGPHPFVTGPQVVDRGLHLMGECARAQRDRFRMAGA